MTGPMKAAAAAACLLGLAACGGGGGGGAGGGPTPTPTGYHFERNAAAVATIDEGIVAHTPGDPTVIITGSRTLVSYDVVTVGDNAPAVRAINLGAGGESTALQPTDLGGGLWQFVDTFTSGDTEYRGTVLMRYDTTMTGNDRHFWGVWMRQSQGSGGAVVWDGIESFNYRFTSGDTDIPTNEQNAHTGSATYTGWAEGIYTKDGTAAGWFSANAELTATFGGGDAADRFTVTGTIDNFDLSGNESNNWSVELTGGPRKDNSGTPTDNVWTGTTSAGGTQNGAFRLQFAGPSSPQLPPVLMGTFDAHFSDGKAVGAVSTNSGS